MQLDTEEVQWLWLKTGEVVSAARAEEIIRMVDTNSDGQLDFDEFMECMEIMRGTLLLSFSFSDDYHDQICCSSLIKEKSNLMIENNNLIF